MSPHHLQRSDAAHEQTLAESLAAVLPYAWGAAELSMDAEALSRGIVALTRFRGIMPSGLCLNLNSFDPELPAARPLGDHLQPNAKGVDVYLGIPRGREGVSNVGADAAARTRYKVLPAECFDLVAGGSAQTIELASPNLVLLFEHESRDDFECVRVAEIVRDASGVARYSEAFVPPCLRIAAADFLMASLRRLLASMGAKSRELQAQLRVRDQSSVEYNAADITHFLLLNTVNKHLPVVRHMSDAGDVSAHAAYLHLSQLAGELCSFSINADPASLPVYRHEEPRQTFEELFARLTSLLRSSVANRHLIVALKARHDGVHFGELSDPELLKESVRFVLAVESSAAENQVSHAVTNLGKLGSWSDIQHLVSSATSGIALANTRAPKEIPIRPNHTYFSISTDSPYWRNALLERRVALYLPPPLQESNVRVTLYAIP